MRNVSDVMQSTFPNPDPVSGSAYGMPLRPDPLDGLTGNAGC